MKLSLPLNRFISNSNKLKRSSFVLLFLLFLVPLIGQQSRLANQYYANGEFEKAAALYQQIYDKEPADYYFQRLVECYITLKNYNQAKALIESEVQKKPNDVTLYVAKGNLHERMQEMDLAKKQYNLAIEKLDANHSNVDRLASVFNGYNLYEEAARTYEKGVSTTKDTKAFAFNLAEIYRRLGKNDLMIKQYLLAVPQFAQNMDYIKATFERVLSEDQLKLLQKEIFVVMQTMPDDVLYSEILEWSYMQQKDYKKALRQSKAIDRKIDNAGSRVFNMGNIAYLDEDYDTAIDAYSFITENYSVNSSYYLAAKRALLNAKKNKITKSFNYTKEDLISLQTEYSTFLETYGRNSQTAMLMIEQADFEALFMNDLPKARSILLEVIEFGGVPQNDISFAKLKLGDYYLMDGDRWEASLLYSQVDKTFKEGVLGEDARYKNAKLSYYTGDFEWAQQQFDILKSATSRLIANDAIDMNVFIMDNLNLDTTDATLSMFADAELLVFQNKHDEAFAKLDSVIALYPEHSLVDDVLYTKAQIYKKIQQPEKMIALFNTIIEKYPEEIRADNAIYELARLYEVQLNNPKLAQDLYFKLFTEYTGSTFTVDARKRYRLLRGDEI
jgi:tetratricopeptide (TPR) repeat protein